MADVAQPSTAATSPSRRIGTAETCRRATLGLARKTACGSKNSRWDLIGMIVAAVASGALVIGLCVAFYVGTYFFLTKGHASWMALLFWALFLWWQVFPVFVAGFGANFEFKNLLRFPLSLKAFYLLGLGYGFADFAAVSSHLLDWVDVGGGTTVRISVVPVLLLVCLLFVLLNVTLERLIGSWLEKILAKRRARELFLGLFILSMVSLNFLSPLLQQYGHSARPKFCISLLISGGLPDHWPEMPSRGAGHLRFPRGACRSCRVYPPGSSF